MTLRCEGSFALPRGLWSQCMRQGSWVGPGAALSLRERRGLPVTTRLRRARLQAAGTVSLEVRAPFPFSPHGKSLPQSKAVSSQAQPNPK